MSVSQPVILLAEDDDNDIFFMRRALKKAEIDSPLHVVRDGQEALDYLGGVGPFADRQHYPLPGIVFLDLKMPFLGGFDVLTWLRSQPPFKNIPVVILTSSSEDRDRRMAGELGARAYCVKPPGTEMVREMMRLANESGKGVSVSAPRCYDIPSDK
ncbi:MAG TPA: response regulator [Verrucomicrobiae bacterium]|jgi:CheY-like chemotaxis protein|nr:response regulator [Verrucomicrobiae bacterium]